MSKARQLILRCSDRGHHFVVFDEFEGLLCVSVSRQPRMLRDRVKWAWTVLRGRLSMEADDVVLDKAAQKKLTHFLKKTPNREGL